jgi:hypothetical protein
MTNISAQEHGLDFTVTLTAEDAKFTDEAVAAGVPLIVVTMFRDALRKLVAAEREACIKLLEDFSQTQMVPVKDTWRMGLIAGANALRTRSRE